MEVFIFIMYNPYPTLKSCLNLRDKRATSVCSYTDIQKKVLQERTKNKNNNNNKNNKKNKRYTVTC